MPVALESQKLLTWLPRDDQNGAYTPAEIPIVGRIMSMILSLLTLCVLSICITRRVQHIRRWSTIPLGAWYILLIYVDSFLFVFITAVFKDVGLNETVSICRGAILLCLTLYLSTKVCVYLFLVEKAYIVRGSNESRYKDKLYIFNICGAMGPYGVLAILNIIWRFSHVNDGTCVIGMEKRALMPLIIFDVAVNVYLTALFIVPLRQLYSYKSSQTGTLHTMAVRTFFGSCATLTSSIANLTLLMVLDGEPAWICFLSCNVEILFSCLTLHWVTSRDRTGQTTNRSYSHSNGEPGPSGGHNNSGSHPLSYGKQTRSRDRDRNGNIMGTETLISEHYQDRAHAAAASSTTNRGGHGRKSASVSVWPEADEESTTGMLSGSGGGGGGGIFGSHEGETGVRDAAEDLGSSSWPEDTRAVVSASCGRAESIHNIDDDDDGDDNGGNDQHHRAVVAQGIALGRIVVTKQSEVRALTREEERRERELAAAAAAAGPAARRGVTKGGGGGGSGGRSSRNSRHGSRSAIAGAGVVMATAGATTTAALQTAGAAGVDGAESSDTESSRSTTGGGRGGAGSAREGSTDSMILAAPGPVHMV
ncbi:ring finger domain protein [Diplodia corticola]|uniref:Ring finger domain protein n=1 Tax=Diplodia corticola TaxID=236234 RepID=A0A1J9QUZ0_9PEZI|nr:ring finger domain protein [Diplodia corticola]OJD32248.1 ring finger domain protein [Diplodia corticola]